MGADHIKAAPECARSKLVSDMVIVDGWAYVSGLQPIDLAHDGEPLPETVEDQTRKVLSNLQVLLKAAGLGKEHVVKVHVSLVDFPRFYERMNGAYLGFFPSNALPARSCAGVTHLTRSALVEMDFVLRMPPR